MAPTGRTDGRADAAIGRFPHRHLFHFLFLAAPLSFDPMIRAIKRWMLSLLWRDGMDGGGQELL